MVDEFVFGVREAAWPAMRADLGLSYAAIGILLTVPALVSGLLEPCFGLLANAARRRAIITTGGAVFSLALVIIAGAGSFAVVLCGFVLLYPASGAFVSLSQATLMDLDPEHRERNMARWVLAGSVGVVAGPSAIAVTTWLGWGWRPLFLLLALASIPLLLRLRSVPYDPTSAGAAGFQESATTAWKALRNRQVLRWLAVLHLTDLLGDVLTGFLALYFVDVVHVPVAQAVLAIVVWTGAGVVGDALLVPLLSRVSGLTHLRVSAILAGLVYPGFLLAPGYSAKLVLLALLGLLRAGWYAIPQGRLYGELHGNSGVALAVSNIAGLLSGMFPVIIGVLAESAGLGTALWACSLAPVALLIGVGVQNNRSRPPPNGVV